MFEDYEGLKTTELRTLKLRLISAGLALFMLPISTFINVPLAFIAMLLYACWVLLQWPFLRKLHEFPTIRRLSKINFIVDFTLMTVLILDNAKDALWTSYAFYSLEFLQAIVIFGSVGGIISTGLALLITLSVGIYRINDMGEPVNQTAYRLGLLALIGTFSSYGLSRIWAVTRQAARTDAINELNRNLVATEMLDENQLYLRIDTSIRKLMRADSFILALFPSQLERQNAITKGKLKQIIPAIVTINHDTLALTEPRLGWNGNTQVKLCISKGEPTQKNKIKNSLTKLSSTQQKTLPWYVQYSAGRGSYLYAPLLLDELLLGIISVHRSNNRTYDLSAQALFGELATLCSSAIINSRIATQQNRRIAELALLNQISSDFAQTNEFSTMVTKLRTRLQDFFEADNVRFVLNEINDSDEPEPEINLRVGSLEGITDTGIRQAELDLLNDVIVRRASLLVPDLQQIISLAENSPDPSQEGTLKGSYIAVPLVFDEEVFGTLAVYRQEANRYSQSDLQLLETVAHQTTTAIQNIRLSRQTLHNLEEVRELYYMLMSKEGELQLEVEERARFEGAVMTARTIGHEIGQPLTAILGLVSLARNGFDLEAKDLEMLEQETLRARDIIAKLRSVVRFETKTYIDQTNMLDLEASSAAKTTPSSKPKATSKEGRPIRPAASNDDVQAQILLDSIAALQQQQSLPPNNKI
jgi:GAF domain-containing protein